MSDSKVSQINSQTTTHKKTKFNAIFTIESNNTEKRFEITANYNNANLLFSGIEVKNTNFTNKNIEDSLRIIEHVLYEYE